ncbi:hypothetical protein L208DRAFT_1403936 [Tricholoma matsutake]|nr:hypothetical protein L208DRAFT_1403936 [Tricholoma matsutake 945]
MEFCLEKGMAYWVSELWVMGSAYRLGGSKILWYGEYGLDKRESTVQYSDHQLRTTQQFPTP